MVLAVMAGMLLAWWALGQTTNPPGVAPLPGTQRTTNPPDSSITLLPPTQYAYPLLDTNGHLIWPTNYWTANQVPLSNAVVLAATGIVTSAAAPIASNAVNAAIAAGPLAPLGTNNGRALTNLSLPTIRVSANAYDYTNNWPYGVFTPGTKTYGLQEAINQMRTAGVSNAFANGINIELGTGDFVISNTIYLSNTAAPLEIHIKGQGKTLTKLKLTGAATNIISTTTETYAAPGSASLNVSFQDMVFVDTVTNRVSTLLYLHALNEVTIDDCLFVMDNTLTNSGAALNYTPGGGTIRNLCQGLWTRGDNFVHIVNRTAFWGLARGARIDSDHAEISTTIFDGPRDSESYFSVEADEAGATVPKSFGLRVRSSYPCKVIGCVFDGCTVPIFSCSLVDTLFSEYDDCIYTSAVDTGGGFITTLNGQFSPFNSRTNISINSSGTIAPASATAVQDLFYPIDNSGNYGVVYGLSATNNGDVGVRGNLYATAYYGDGSHLTGVSGGGGGGGPFTNTTTFGSRGNTNALTLYPNGMTYTNAQGVFNIDTNTITTTFSLVLSLLSAGTFSVTSGFYPGFTNAFAYSDATGKLIGTNLNTFSPSLYFAVPSAAGSRTMLEGFSGNDTSFELNWATEVNASSTITKANILDTTHQGVAALTLANVNASRCNLSKDSSDADDTFGGGTWYIEWLQKFDSAVTGTPYWRLGFINTRSDGASPVGAWFQFDSTSANWRCSTASAAGTGTTNTTSTAVGTGWHVLGMKVAGDASSVVFYVDGTSIRTNTTTIPTGTGSPFTVLLQAYRPTNDGSASQILYLDYLWSCFVPTTFP